MCHGYLSKNRLVLASTVWVLNTHSNEYLQHMIFKIIFYLNNHQIPTLSACGGCGGGLHGMGARFCSNSIIIGSVQFLRIVYGLSFL